MNKFWLLLLASDRPRLSVRQRGFTLIEVLIALLIGGIVVSSGLLLAVDLLQAEERNRSFTETEREVKAALDFIVSDLREAVYVYTGEQLVTANDTVEDGAPIADHLAITGGGDEMILAFWKVEQLPYRDSDCADSEACLSNLEANDVEGDRACAEDVTIDGVAVTEASEAGFAADLECRSLIQERTSYTLVVYVQDTELTATWDGPTTIKRYELRKYDAPSLTTTNVTRRAGYVDPRDESTFARWPYDANDNNLQGELPNWPASPPVLVDYIDDPTADASGVPTCGDGYVRSPLAPADGVALNSFFACVRDPEPAPGDIISNQDVILYLRGNPVARSNVGVPEGLTLPSAQAQVLIRGVTQRGANRNN